MYWIEVDGNIIIQGGFHHTYLLTCGSVGPNEDQIRHLRNNYRPTVFDRVTRRIKGNLFLSDKVRAVPYASYLVHGGIVIDGDITKTDIWSGEGYEAPFSYWEESVISAKKKCELDIPETFNPTFLNGLYVECWGAFELLLCDVLLSMIYTRNDCYQKAEDCWREKGTDKNSINLTVEAKVHKFIFEQVYHNSDVVNRLFMKITGISLPNWERIKKRLPMRNNIVHRRSLSNLDRMTETNAFREDVLSLLEEMGEFADNLKTKVL